MQAVVLVERNVQVCLSIVQFFVLYNHLPSRAVDWPYYEYGEPSFPLGDALMIYRKIELL